MPLDNTTPRAVEAWQGGQLAARGVTDANGYYGFATLKAGPVEVRVSGQRWTDTVPARGIVRLPDLLVRDLPAVPASSTGADGLVGRYRQMLVPAPGALWMRTVPPLCSAKP